MFWQIFDKKNEITELCKGVHCVDLGESFQTHIFLQNLASIQPRTSPVKFAGGGGPAAPCPRRSRRSPRRHLRVPSILLRVRRSPSGVPAGATSRVRG